MDLSRDTKLRDLLAAYPWLVDEAVKIDKRLGVLRSPLGRALIRRADVAEAARRMGVPSEEVIRKVEELIEKHSA